MKWDRSSTSNPLPGIPGKSIKGVLVEYGPGPVAVAYTRQVSDHLRNSHRRRGAQQGQRRAGKDIPHRRELDGIAMRPSWREWWAQARRSPAKILAIFVVDDQDAVQPIPDKKW